MSGLKNEGTRRLIDALNSVKEDETFPAEKLTTIRRCSEHFIIGLMFDTPKSVYC